MQEKLLSNQQKLNDIHYNYHKIEEEIFCLENFEEEEDVDNYLECFYDICDDVRAWIAI